MKKYLPFIPNSITVFRIILIFLFEGILVNRLIPGSAKMPATIYVIFVFICLSDFLDGLVARGLKAESTLGGILDISADSLFIFSSLITFNFFSALPVWFTVIVLVHFLVFLTTSKLLIQSKPAILRGGFVFDKAGRIAALLFYLIPAITCAVYSYPSNGGFPVLYAVICLSVILSAISISGRCVSCFAALRCANGGQSVSK